ncbi:N-formyl peptide receptor 3 [Exaiptasia diaphana]|uniref:G-protein coupled receptors family 1 profile domain-containing protein n=1 Tax=Exaiptasia diaphana TaxID=2652724 RepID=A0A913WTD9_EXADI|nr:N-formyl peptide receptor 3 [Exaiptasia diaphana]
MNSTINTTAPGPTTFTEPQASIGFRLTLFGVVIFSSLVGNFMVVKAYRQQPHLKKPFTYLLVTNLAIAEFIGTLCLPFFQVYDELKSWPFGDSMCRLINACMLISYFVIPWSLAAIAFVRCKAFSSGQLFHLSGRITTSVLALMWISGLLVSGPTYIFAKQIKAVYGNHNYWCIELFPGDTLTTFPSAELTRYYFVRFILNFALPGLIIIMGYGGVALKLKRHLTNKKCICSPSNTQVTSVIELDPELPAKEKPSSEDIAVISSPSCTLALPRENPNAKLNQVKNMEHDLLRMIYIIVVVYLVCYIPYQTVFLMEYFWHEPWMKSEYYAIIRKYVYLITCLPSALHPICYGTMSKFYAQAFSTVMLCKKKPTKLSNIIFENRQ